MICFFYHIRLEDVEKYPITQYREMVNGSINLANLIRGGDFELETFSDRENRALREYNRLKAEGKIGKKIKADKIGIK